MVSFFKVLIKHSNVDNQLINQGKLRHVAFCTENSHAQWNFGYNRLLSDYCNKKQKIHKQPASLQRPSFMSQAWPL